MKTYLWVGIIVLVVIVGGALAFSKDGFAPAKEGMSATEDSEEVDSEKGEEGAAENETENGEETGSDFEQEPQIYSGSATLALGESGTFPRGLVITPDDIAEDSRCPIDVECVWEGAFRAGVKISLNGNTENYDFTLGSSVNVGTYTITLTKVEPSQREGQEIAWSEYRLTFKVD